MNSLKKTGMRVAFLACLAVMVLSLCGCKDPKLTVNYYIDGRKTDTLPDQGLYEIKSIKCSFCITDVFSLIPEIIECTAQ